MAIHSEAAGFIRDEDGNVEYRVRDFNAFDAMPIGEIVAKVTGDPNVIAAMASGDQNQMLLAFATTALSVVPRKVFLLCADFVGETRGYDIEDYVKQEMKEAQADGRRQRTVGELRTKMEDDILEKFKLYPGGAMPAIIEAIISKPGFEDFLTSSSQLGTAIPNAFKSLQTKSKGSTSSKKKKS